MVGKRREQTVHHRYGQNHQQADDGVQTQEAAAAAAAAEPPEPVHEGAGPSNSSRRGEEGPRGAAETPAETPAAGRSAGAPSETLSQCRT